MQHLDDSQREFCEAPKNNNIRLLAPAGCGKTLCLLHRCKYLANQKSDKKLRFLIVTFTRAAEQELSARLSDDPAFSSLKSVTDVEVTTLNAWGWKRINKVSNCELIRDSKTKYIIMNKALHDTWKKHKRIREAIEGKSPGKKKVKDIERRLVDIIDRFKSLGFNHIYHNDVSKFIDHMNILYDQNLESRLKEIFDELYKCRILDKNAFKNTFKIDDFQEDIGESLFEVLYLHSKTNSQIRKFLADECYKYFFRFWIKACIELEKMNVFTMEDQKYIPFITEDTYIKNGELVARDSSYDYVFVDEFQDINPLDLNLVKAIVQRNQSKLTIVGDDDQAIFEWRGATPQYILDPDRFFDMQFDTYKLEINYRSPSNIVRFSQNLIAKNKNRIKKNIRSANNIEAEVKLCRPQDLRDALEIVHQELCKGKIEESDEKKSNSRIAIIGRKRSEIIPYQVYFASEMKIRFYAAEDLQFFLSDTFDQLLSLLEIKAKTSKNLSVQDIIQLCNHIRKYPLQRNDKRNLQQYLYTENINMLGQEKVIEIIENYPGPWKGSKNPGDVSLLVADALRDFVKAESVSDVLRSFQEKFNGLQRDFGKADEDIFYVDPPFQQLKDYAASYGNDYDRFMDNIRSAQSTLAKDDECKDDPSNYNVHLMTAPRAKGKEFDIVVLLNFRKGNWPDRRASIGEVPKEVKQREEAERRLFYVAFTRAKKKVVMMLDKLEEEDSPYIHELELSQ